MRVLRESVEKLGILVPVTVYQAPADHRPKREKFILLDGERRWRCAKELEIPQIPAIIVEQPSETQNILTMFHIHNVREGWQLMPTALKLKTLMNKLGEVNERKLSELTKLSVAQIRRCKILLTYSERFQEMMLAPPTERMKADFFIELDRIRRPALEDVFEPWVARGDDQCIDILLEKYESGIIKAVTDFRQLAEVYRASNTSRRQKRLAIEFNKFLDDPPRGIGDIDVPGATFAREAKEIHRSAKRLLAQVANIDFETISSNTDLVKILQVLMHTLNDKLTGSLLLGVKDATEADDDSGNL